MVCTETDVAHHVQARHRVWSQSSRAQRGVQGRSHRAYATASAIPVAAVLVAAGCASLPGHLRATEPLEYVPSHFEEIRHVRPKQACVACALILPGSGPQSADHARHCRSRVDRECAGVQALSGRPAHDCDRRCDSSWAVEYGRNTTTVPGCQRDTPATCLRRAESGFARSRSAVGCGLIERRIVLGGVAVVLPDGRTKDFPR
jgi:hypothetical protein